MLIILKGIIPFNEKPDLFLVVHGSHIHQVDGVIDSKGAYDPLPF
jgi:hypothetical protein